MKQKELTPIERLEKIEKILRKAEFDGFVPQCVVEAHKIAKQGLKRVLA